MRKFSVTTEFEFVEYTWNDLWTKRRQDAQLSQRNHACDRRTDRILIARPHLHSMQCVKTEKRYIQS